MQVSALSMGLLEAEQVPGQQQPVRTTDRAFPHPAQRRTTVPWGFSTFLWGGVSLLKIF